MTGDEPSIYNDVIAAAGGIIAISAVLGSHLEDPRFEPIRDAWEEKMRETVNALNNMAEELTLFGEAYEGE